MGYITSREDCEKNITGVCGGCGGNLSAMETVDNSGRPTFWSGCEHCGCFRNGVSLRHFKIARRLVEEGVIIPYRHMHRHEYEDTSERLEYFLESQTAGLVNSIFYIEKLLQESIIN